MAPSTTSCRRIIDSPTVQATNSLLWGENTAILVRGIDWYDDKVTQERKFQENPAYITQNTPLLPASLIHASMRAPNTMYGKHGSRRAAAGVLVGRQLVMNNHHSNNTVSFPVCYPSDAGSYKRNALNQNGKGCNPDSLSGICLREQCLTNTREMCGCNSRQVPPHEMGRFFSEWVPWIGGKQRGLNLYTCWYDNWKDMVVASNSLWLHRQNWSLHTQTPLDYQGWNECPATANIRDLENLDAILVQLPFAPHANASLCEYGVHIHNDIQVALRPFHDRAYHSLPVVFLEQVEGMTTTTECAAVWNDTDCQNGFRKELFAQEWTFQDGSCLTIPPDCQDVYYFSYNNVTRACNVSSDVCRQEKRRESKSGNALPQGSFTSGYGRMLALQAENRREELPTMTSVWTVLAVSIVVSALLSFQLRRRRRRRRTSHR